MIHYVETPPPPQLADRVECFWQMRTSEPVREAAPYLVLPDARSDLIFDVGDGPAPDAPSGGLRAYAVGTMTRALRVPLTGRVDVVGIRLRLGAGPASLGLPAPEVADAVVPMDDVWRDGRHLPERLAGCDPGARPALLAAAVGPWLARPAADPDARIVAAADRLGTRVGAGAAPVDGAARAVGLGRRQLERRFRDELGVTPRVVARILRLQRAAALLRHYTPARSRSGAPLLPLARVALRAGYADQAHMTREFRALTGLTPAGYRDRHAGPDPGS